jgi:acetoin utilization protein AcuB
MDQFTLPVEEFTTPDPVAAPEDASVEELNQLMSEHGVRHIPIVKDGRVVGIVSQRDLKVVSGLDMQEKNLVCAGDIMARDPVSVSASTPLDEVAFEMSNRKIGSVIVNEGEELLGIFTVTDALNALIEIARSQKK